MSLGVITTMGMYISPTIGRGRMEEIHREIIDNYKSNRSVRVVDFNFSNIDCDCHVAKGLDGGEFCSVCYVKVLPSLCRWPY